MGELTNGKRRSARSETGFRIEFMPDFMATASVGFPSRFKPLTPRTSTSPGRCQTAPLSAISSSRASVGEGRRRSGGGILGARS